MMRLIIAYGNQIFTKKFSSHLNRVNLYFKILTPTPRSAVK